MIISALVLGVGVCPVALATTLTLEEAALRAFDHAPNARIARLEAARAEDDVSLAESSYYPLVGMSSQAGWSNRMNDTLEAVDAEGRVHKYPISSLGSQEGWFNVFVKQLVFDLGKWRLIEQNEIEAEAARISEAQEEETVTFDVLSRYTDVLRLQHLLDVEDQAVRNAERLDGQAQILLEAGKCVPAQREEVRVHLETAKVNATVRRDQLASERTALVIAIGDPELVADSLVLDPESLPAMEGAPDLEGAISHVETAPEVRILDARRRAEEVRVSAARAECYPKVDVVAGYSNYGIKRYDSYPDEVHAGIDFKMSIFDGFRTKHMVSSALKDLEIARLRYQSLLDAKRARVSDLARQLAAAQRRAELRRQQAKLSAKRMDLADLSLKAERGDLDAALAAHRQRTQNAQAAVEAEYARIRLWATLLHESGQLARTIVGERAGAQP